MIAETTTAALTYLALGALALLFALMAPLKGVWIRIFITLLGVGGLGGFVVETSDPRVAKRFQEDLRIIAKWVDYRFGKK